MNNGHYHTKEYKAKQSAKNDRIFGPVELHEMVCADEICQKPYMWEGRKKTKAYELQLTRYCSRACANSVGGKAKAAIHHPDETAQYTTVCWRHHPKECVVCDEQNIVAVHHYNENHDDNRPENLVPLCPTHHNYMHSRYKYLIENQVSKYVNNFTGP